MEIKKLSDVAFIDISGVDKKIEIDEKRVKLCNFTDVYYNWSVNKENIIDFMEASASDNEIHRFSLKKGSVAITKDSETRDDIGISCYIADDLDNTVLGYHTALIIPNKEELDGSYLNAYLHTTTARKYFSNQASGSGQRYTLTIKGIGSVKIPIIDLDEQKRIGNLFETVENKIKVNNSINVELESMAKTLYDYWFLQFEFPNEEGKPYKSSGGKMVYNEELKREIPEGWEVKSISNIANLYQPQTISGDEIKKQSAYYVYGANGIVGMYDKYNHENNEIAICCRGAGCGNFLMTQPKCWITGNAMVVTPKNNIYKEYLFYGLSIEKIAPFVTGSAQPQITRTNIEKMKIIVATDKIVQKFNNFAESIRLELQKIFNENQELASLRDFLLPLLMNGQVTFKDGE